MGNNEVMASYDQLSVEYVRSRIYNVRGIEVMIDTDLADMYGVETKQLKRQVKRNIERFPEDFMFELTEEEYASLRCQNGTIESGRGQHSKYLILALYRYHRSARIGTKTEKPIGL